MSYKIAICAICKNESKFVQRWLDAVEPADYICVLDTGSTDKTVELFKAAEQEERFKNKLIFQQLKEPIVPFRFDTARNLSLLLVPSDVDIILYPDLDEICTPGWREQILSVWKPDTLMCCYSYAQECDKEEKPIRVINYNKCYANKPFIKWFGCVHEYCEIVNQPLEFKDHTVYVNSNFILYRHLPDKTKSRSFYIDLIAQRYEEDKDFAILCFGASSFKDNPKKGIEWIKNTMLPLLLAKPSIGKVFNSDEERRQCFWQAYQYLAIYTQLINPKNYEEILKYFELSLSYDYTNLNNYVFISDIYLEQKRYQDAINVLTFGQLNSKQIHDWRYDPSLWIYKYDTNLCIAYYYLGDYKKSYIHAKLAWNKWNSDKGWKDDSITKFLSYNVELLTATLKEKGIITNE